MKLHGLCGTINAKIVESIVRQAFELNCNEE